MQPGQKYYCEHCHSNTVAKLERQLDGFKVVEEYLACMFCHARIPEEKSAEQPESDARPKNPALDSLTSLFGCSAVNVKQEKEILSELTKTKRQFCKDCRHYIVHPFHSRCDLTNKGADPMDDCPKFEKRPVQETEK